MPPKVAKKGNTSNLVSAEKREKMNKFYKKDRPKFEAHLGNPDNLTRGQKSFLMKRAWSHARGENVDSTFPYSSWKSYESKMKSTFAARDKKKQQKKERKQAAKAKVKEQEKKRKMKERKLKSASKKK